jgi:hypothetical protein
MEDEKKIILNLNKRNIDKNENVIKKAQSLDC